MEQLILDTSSELAKVGLKLNMEKSKTVSAEEGFTYLGFDIRSKNTMVEDLIARGDFSSAEELVNKPDVEESFDDESMSGDEAIQSTSDEIETENFPDYILSLAENCHIIRQMIETAKEEKHLSYPEKHSLLHIFNCMGDDGNKYLHWILSHCDDYDYATTQGYFDRCRAQHPLGCRKLCERFSDICDKSKCECDFSGEDMYSSPVIHARRIKEDCISVPEKDDTIGHFKQLPTKLSLDDAISRLMELNKKEAEIVSHKKICYGQIENLLLRSNATEIETSQGLLIKKDDGIFLKVA
jgi:hypothetical protein